MIGIKIRTITIQKTKSSAPALEAFNLLTAKYGIRAVRSTAASIQQKPTIFLKVFMMLINYSFGFVFDKKHSGN